MSRIRFTFSRPENLAYLSHLDLMRMFVRALRRSGLPLAYSKGFNPHPRFALALPLPLGVTAANEPGEVYFTESLTPDQFLKVLADHLPEGLKINRAVEANPEAPALAAQVQAADYSAVYRMPDSGKADLQMNDQLIAETLQLLLARDEIIHSRVNKKKKLVHTNVRPYIMKAEVEREAGGHAAVRFLLKAGSEGGVSPHFLLGQLALLSKKDSLKAECWDIHRNGLFYYDGDILKPLSEGM